jgi:hypothetical protein
LASAFLGGSDSGRDSVGRLGPGSVVPRPRPAPVWEFFTDEMKVEKAGRTGPVPTGLPLP